MYEYAAETCLLATCVVSSRSQALLQAGMDVEACLS